jgi:hypothetical protein
MTAMMMTGPMIPSRNWPPRSWFKGGDVANVPAL